MLPFPAEHRVLRPHAAAASQPTAARPAAARSPASQRAAAAPAAAPAVAPPATVDASAAAARRATIAQLRRVLAAGHSRFDPLRDASAAPLQVQHGLSAGRKP